MYMNSDNTSKNWFQRHKILTGILCVIAFIYIVGSVAEDKKTESLAPSVQNTTAHTEATPTDTKEKTYQLVTTFTGNGTKNSEPFVITGGKFKIEYDCKGSLCSASLYKTGDQLTSGLIMNVAGSTKDETVLYGSGEYYISAMTMGSYTMKVYDWK